MGLKILWQNVHILLNSRWDIITNVDRNHATKLHILLKSLLDITNVSKKSCDKKSTFRWTANRTSQIDQKILWQTILIFFRETVDLMSQSILRRVENVSHVTNHSSGSLGWWKNLVQAKECHRRQFVGWTDSVGQVVAWLVRVWTDHHWCGVNCTAVVLIALTTYSCCVILDKYAAAVVLNWTASGCCMKL